MQDYERTIETIKSKLDELYDEVELALSDSRASGHEEGYEEGYEEGRAFTDDDLEGRIEYLEAQIVELEEDLGSK